jgi:glycerophosphoryl diester phosphodiesterase
MECDVQASRDGVPFVFHDRTLDRLTAEAGPLAARTADRLDHVTLAGSGEPLLRLDALLRLVAGRQPLLIEVKAPGRSVARLCQGVRRALEGYRGPVAVMSFNPHAVLAFGRAAPGIARGLTTSAFDPADWAPLPAAVCDRLRAIPDYAATGASFISHEARDLARPRVAELRAQGAAVLCWTIRSPEAEAAARQHAQNITFEGYAAPFPA